MVIATDKKKITGNAQNQLQGKSVTDENTFKNRVKKDRQVHGSPEQIHFARLCAVAGEGLGKRGLRVNGAIQKEPVAAKEERDSQAGYILCHKVVSGQAHAFERRKVDSYNQKCHKNATTICVRITVRMNSGARC